VSRLGQLLGSTIGQKLVMAVTGLLLIGFLGVHLGGNLLVFVGADAFNAYSHALVSNPLVYVAEAGLLALFVGHFAHGIVLTLRNQAARPIAYERRVRAGHTSHRSVASATMIATGLVVLVFVPLHVWTFKLGPYYGSAADPAVRDIHRLVIEVFQRPLLVGWYVLAMVVIGFHLWHGFGSGFESLGVAHRVGLRRVGQVLAVVLAGGFHLIPLVVYLGGGRP
jgi:succinate dehydrogenase / fumarate reductase cytochrome b subunit